MGLELGIEYKGRKSTCVGGEDREKKGRGGKGQAGGPTSLSPTLENAEAKTTVWKPEGRGVKDAQALRGPTNPHPPVHALFPGHGHT